VQRTYGAALNYAFGPALVGFALVELFMFEAAKERQYSKTFETEDDARRYVSSAASDNVRPCIRNLRVSPMIDSFIVIGGRDVKRREQWP
jgi:hypothetical protein